jgi:integrase/recombinase XerD
MTGSKGLGRQAKVLSEGQVKAALASVTREGYGARPERDAAMILLSVRAGLRAKEVASVTWSMVTDAEGQLVDTLALPDIASKGRTGGRMVPLAPDLCKALARLYGDGKAPGSHIVLDTRGQPMRANTIAVWFRRLYAGLGFEGCSSHSGRRTAITRWARGITAAGGSLRDVQDLAGHADLGTTARYIDRNPDAQRRVVIGG